MHTAPSRVLLRNGHVYSPSEPTATAMFTVGGRIEFVGPDDRASAYTDPADVVVDLAGRLVTPGFVDAHVHVSQTGFALESLDLSRTSSLADALASLESHASSDTHAVLFAHGWDESRWPENRPPTMAEIDRAVGLRPACVTRVDGHSSVLSSALVRRCPDLSTLVGWSPDGRVTRDAHHVVRETVASMRTEGERVEAIRTALRHAASRGLTSLHDLNAPHISPASDLQLTARLRRDEALPQVAAYWGGFLGDGLTISELDGSDPQLCGFAGDLNVDGSFGSHTAALRQAYADAETKGCLYLEPGQVRDHVVFCTKQDLQAGFHVIGDAGMDSVVEGLRLAAEVVGEAELARVRHRLEHVEMVTPEQIATLAALGVVASVQPAFDELWGGPGALYEQRLGPERSRQMNAFGSMHRAGLVLAFGSDSPVTPLDPWASVRAAVHHHNGDERLTVRAAFSAHTRGGHRARGDDHAGVLEPGAAASYAIWDVPPASDPSEPGSSDSILPSLNPEDSLPACVRTVVDGTTVFDVEGAL